MQLLAQPGKDNELDQGCLLTDLLALLRPERPKISGLCGGSHGCVTCE
jgi:hypothetical protein